MDGACQAREHLGGTSRAARARACSIAASRNTSRPGSPTAAKGHDDDGPVPAHVEREFRRYLECGILAHGSVVAD